MTLPLPVSVMIGRLVPAAGGCATAAGGPKRTSAPVMTMALVPIAMA